MLRLLSGVAFLALLGCGESVTDTPTHIENTAQNGWTISPIGGLNRFFECLEDEGVALVSAHRGGAYPGYPENALESMAAVMSDTPAIMEVDVATSSDGVLYLMHDDTLDRTTTGSGDVSDVAWREVRKLRLEDKNNKKTSFTPTRFDKALAWAHSRTILQIDFKRSTRYEDVIDEIYRQGAEDRVILIAYSIGAAKKLHRLAPDAMISLSLDTQSALNKAVAAGIPDNRILGFTGNEDPRPRLFSILNGRNVEVIFGTLGGRQSIDQDIAQSGYDALYGEIAAQGADIIATDRPREAHLALAEAGRGIEDGDCGVSFTFAGAT